MAFEINDPDRLAALAALGLGPDAKARDIISAYRRLARESHPDMSGGQPPIDPSFATISDAYHFLTRGSPNPPEPPMTATDPNEAVRPDAEGVQPEGEHPDPLAFGGFPFAPWADAEPMFEAGPVIIRPLPPESR